MSTVDYLELLKLAAPETIVVAAAVAVLFVDLVIMRDEPMRHRLLIGGAVTGLGCLVALLWLAKVPVHAAVLGGVLVVDPLTQWVKGIVLVLTLCTAALSLHAKFTEHVGEYFTLVLLATCGMMFLVSSDDLLTIFVSLELTSLCLYILTAFSKRDRSSAEAGLKYFLFGGMAAAFTLYGLSLVYGLAGTTNLRAAAAALAGQGLTPLLAVALIMVVIGFGFKVAAVPFHLWAPDAYQGAPTPAAALIASGSKVASFFVLAKVLMLGFAGVEGSGAWRQFSAGWAPLLATLAVVSMLLGNLAALAQRRVKRLLAYSAIAHAGYLLLGLLALANSDGRPEALAALVYYLATYGLTTVGAFGVLGVLERVNGSDRLEDFIGLSRRAPGLALCLVVFLLSLAGIPPLAGFFGKFYVFTAVVGAEPARLGLLWLVALAIALSAVSLYYYLQVLKRAYVVAPVAGADRIVLTWEDRLAVGGLALAVVLLGVFPSLLLSPLGAAIQVAGY
ncbi:MAG: NADH-quinone oxidoreductase subunit N [Verrucomicrobia bacterium]|nr:NADH-quinone oxidoreductase subunit N [Verrucomicrobiota bacterium]